MLTEDEAELLLDMIGPPVSDENPLTTQLRSKLRTFLQVLPVVCVRLPLTHGQALRTGSVASMMEDYYDAKAAGHSEGQ